MVVAAALAVATLAVALPAVDDARAARTDAAIEGTVDRIERAGRSLATTEDATATRETAATRRIEFRLPARSIAAAKPAFVAVGGQPDGPGDRPTVTYAVSSSRRRHLRLPVPLRTPEGPVVFREPGRHAVSLALVRSNDGPELVVTRAAGW
nr:hypothetical protein [Halobellus ruber]